MGAPGSRYHQLFAEAEQAVTNATRDRTEATRWTSATTLESTKDSRRGGSSQWEPKLVSRYVALLLQLLSLQFGVDISAKLSSFEHLIRNTARLDSWIETRTRKSLKPHARSSTSTHSQHQCKPMGKGKVKGKATAPPPPPSPPAETRQPSNAQAKAKSHAWRKNVSTVRRRCM